MVFRNRYNISIEELKEAVKFAEEKNLEVIAIEFESNPIGGIIIVYEDYENPFGKDITNYDRW